VVVVKGEALVAQCLICCNFIFMRPSKSCGAKSLGLHVPLQLFLTLHEMVVQHLDQLPTSGQQATAAVVPAMIGTMYSNDLAPLDLHAFMNMCANIGVGSRGSGRRSKIQRYNKHNCSNTIIVNGSQDNNRQCNCPLGNIMVTKDYYGSYIANEMIGN
jgi:hypothetical protein